MKKCWLLLLCAMMAMAQQRVAPEECFPFESLPEGDRAVAERLLTRLLDSDALYTLTTSMKPIGMGFAYRLLPEGEGEVHSEIAAWRRVLPAFRCGEQVEAAVLPIGPVYRGKQFWQVVIARRDAVRAVESAHIEYFARYGLDSSRGALAMLQQLDRIPGDPVAEGYGYLLGWPDYAVAHAASARSLRRQHRYVPGGSQIIPTFDEKGLQFYWDTPYGHPENEEDTRRKEAARLALEVYREKRTRFIGEGLPGAASLLREWFCREEKGCALPK